jgi:Uncharacterised protein family (UPF0158)
MATHEELWRIVRKLPSDFEPYGQRNRDADGGPDCSCGCRHFMKLAGELGYDWGVCANPKSPRAALLTFEHMGCREFEQEKEGEIGAVTSQIEPLESGTCAETPAAPLKKLKIDWSEFQIALEGFESMTGEDVSYFLDTVTGEIHTLFPDCEEDDELRERIDADSGKRYLNIEPLDSHESFRIMENFAASLPESALKGRLFDALSRNKPFRRFNDVVHSEPSLRGHWFAFRDLAQERYARDWLEVNGIEAEFKRPEPERQNEHL